MAFTKSFFLYETFCDWIPLRKHKTGLTDGNLPVLSKAAMGGNTKFFRLYILHRELLFWDCIHFVLHRATDIRYMRRCDTESESFAVALTSRNDAVDVWRRISVLWESWNTATRLLLSTATLRHKKLQGLTHEADKKSQTFGSFVNVKDICEH